MRLFPVLLLLMGLGGAAGFLPPNRTISGTHFNISRNNDSLFSKKFEIYRLRRQREIFRAFESIFTRQRGLPIGQNISAELIHGISVMDVSLNRDCTHAVIAILASGDLFQQRQCFSWVNRNVKRLRYLMGQMLRHRRNVPTIQFRPFDLDRQMATGAELQEEPTATTSSSTDGTGLRLIESY